MGFNWSAWWGSGSRGRFVYPPCLKCAVHRCACGKRCVVLRVGSTGSCRGCTRNQSGGGSRWARLQTTRLQYLLKARNTFFSQTCSLSGPTTIVPWLRGNCLWESFSTLTLWFYVGDMMCWEKDKCSSFWISLFTTVALISIQGWAMGVCDSDPWRDALPLPSEGSHITRILGKCASKLPWSPSWFNTKEPWGDEPLHVLPSGRRSKVSFRWHNWWISSTDIFKSNFRKLNVTFFFSLYSLVDGCFWTPPIFCYSYCAKNQSWVSKCSLF